MRKRKLKPSQIIVPGEYELGNESILKIYFRIFERGYGNCLPPAIVTQTGNIQEIIDWLENEKYGLKRWEKPDLKWQLYTGTLEARRKDYKDLFSILKKHPFMLIDGNHKSVAATLTHNKISALEVETDEDLEMVRKMVEQGELFDFKREETSLYNLRRSFITYCLDLSFRESDGSIPISGDSSPQIRYTETVEQRVNEMVSNNNLPEYMIEKYLSDKN